MALRAGRVQGIDREPGDGVDDLVAAYSAHYTQLVRLARQFVDDVESAEEAVQEVFVRLHRQGPDRATAGYPYLRTAVLNQCRSHLRRRAVTRGHRWQTAVRAADGEHGPDPATVVADRDLIRSLIARLPRRQKVSWC